MKHHAPLVLLAGLCSACGLFGGGGGGGSAETAPAPETAQAPAAAAAPAPRPVGASQPWSPADPPPSQAAAPARPAAAAMPAAQPPAAAPAPAAAAAAAASAPAGAAVAAAPAEGGAALYFRLGGMTAIRTVVDTFHTRIMSDARINALFRGVDDVNLKRLLSEQICEAAGGPCRYSGRPMPEAHRGLAITDAQFDALVSDLTAALDANHVADREKNELLGILGPLRSQIVGQ
jgi:hemoglobin